MKNPTMNEFNEKMLEDTLNNFNAIYNIYANNADLIKTVDVTTPFVDMQTLVNDILKVESNISKNALCDEMTKLISKTSNSIKRIKKIVDDMGSKFIALRNKMPMPKSEVNKILKMFNFYDYAEDETNEGNFVSQRQINEDAFNATNNNANFKNITKDHLDKIYDEIDGNDVNDLDVAEDDVKEITPEQFMNVVDDTKQLVDKLKNEFVDDNAKKSKKSSRRKKSK